MSEEYHKGLSMFVTFSAPMGSTVGTLLSTECHCTPKSTPRPGFLNRGSARCR